MCQGFSIFSGFLHHFVMVKLATSNIGVKYPRSSNQMDVVIPPPWYVIEWNWHHSFVLWSAWSRSRVINMYFERGQAVFSTLTYGHSPPLSGYSITNKDTAIRPNKYYVARHTLVRGLRPIPDNWYELSVEIRRSIDFSLNEQYNRGWVQAKLQTWSFLSTSVHWQNV